MFNTTRISRRNFLKLNAAFGSALALATALPALATAAQNAQAPSTDARPTLDLPQPTAVRFGTPTDVAATWPGTAWSVDAAGTIHRFDRARHAWLPDEADDRDDFPPDSRMVLTRWGRPAGPHQMLMVLSGAH